mmetsp:Transcript_15849/g.40258  ORF Transcript_15849/g.40258 Transcript_15849/m.40258 type:complete len:534 (-) Transcript_15849:1548-3149(-)
MQSTAMVSRGAAARPQPALSSGPRPQAPAARRHQPAEQRDSLRTGRTGQKVAGARWRSALSAAGPRLVVAVAADEDVFVEELSNENAHITFKVSVSPEFAKNCYNEILEDARAQAEVPGFRKGAKIPEGTMVGFLGGKREMKKLTVERCLRDSLPFALRNVEKVAIADSETIESNPEELIDTFELGKPVIYLVGVDMPPKVRFTTSYKGLKIEVPSCSSPESEEQTVEDLIMQGRKDKGNLRIAQGRGMQPGDVVVVDMNVYKQGTEEELPGAARKKYQIDTGKKNAVFLPGVIEGMLAMEVEDERTISISFPEDWEPAQLAGLSVDAKIKLRELFEYDLAPEDDSLASELYEGAKDMIDLRAQLAKAVAMEAKQINNSRIEQALAEELVKITDADLPRQIVQEVGQQSYQRKIMEQQAKGQISPEVMEKLLTPQMLQNYIKANKEEVEDTVKAMIAIETIFAAEKMVVTEEEKEAAIADTVKDMESEGMEYDREEMLYNAGTTLMSQKVIDFLTEASDIVMLPYDAVLEGAA